MPDKYPRFGGDRKLLLTSILPKNRTMCECCAKAELATHFVRVQFDWDRDNDVMVDVCPHHVGQARRFHTFEKFLAAAEGRE